DVCSSDLGWPLCVHAPRPLIPRGGDALGSRRYARGRRSRNMKQPLPSRNSPPRTSDPGGIAAIEVAGLVAGLVPLLALGGRAMGPFLRLHAALRFLLDAIVADRSRRIERLRDLCVRGRLEVTGVRGVPRPDPSEAVRLKLDADRCGVVLALAGREQTELVLHVMAVLVSHDVSLREWPALGAEALRQLLEEADVEIDLLVVRAIEGSHRGFGEAARALGRVGIENGLRR